jgi:hypothetical protein
MVYQTTYHYSICCPFIFLAIKTPLPGFTWKLCGSQDGNPWSLGVPKVAHNSRNRPKEHPIHDMKNSRIRRPRPFDLFMYLETFLGFAQQALSLIVSVTGLI